jgi:hypothetical protein
LFTVFCHFLLAFGISKNWMVSKARSKNHLFTSLSASRFQDHPAFGSIES